MEMAVRRGSGATCWRADSQDLSVLYFFFQAEDGIRDYKVTGVQTCALPISDAHIPFIAGALNIGDSDHTLALRLASEVITEQPYAPISQQVQKQVRASLAAVELLIICPMPIGPGNLALLQEAVAAGQRGLPVLF